MYNLAELSTQKWGKPREVLDTASYPQYATETSFSQGCCGLMPLLPSPGCLGPGVYFLL